MDDCDSQPVHRSLSVPVLPAKAFKVSRPLQSPVMEECSGTSMPMMDPLPVGTVIPEGICVS